MVRARLAALLRAAVRMQRLAALTRIAEVVAARPAARGWLGARAGPVRAARRRRGVPRRASIRDRRSTAIRATAETVPAGPGPVPRAAAEETERILSWLERPEVRLVEMTSVWSSPVAGAGRFRDLLAKAEGGRVATNSRPNAHEASDRSDDLASLSLRECSRARFVGLFRLPGTVTVEPG